MRGTRSGTVTGRIVEVLPGKSREEFGLGFRGRKGGVWHGKEGGRAGRKGLSGTRWSLLLER